MKRNAYKCTECGKVHTAEQMFDAWNQWPERDRLRVVVCPSCEKDRNDWAFNHPVWEDMKPIWLDKTSGVTGLLKWIENEENERRRMKGK